MERPAPLTLSNVQLARSGQPICTAVDKQLTGGEICLLTGPNGQGKSTLLKACAGWHRPQGGQVQASTAYYLGHANPIQPALTAAENIEYYFQKLKQNIDILVGIPLKNSVDNLSAGQQRRLSLAALWQPAVLAKKLWLLDEPGAALDDASLTILSQQLLRFAQQGGAVLMAVHQVNHWQQLLQTRDKVTFLQLSPPVSSHQEAALDAW